MNTEENQRSEAAPAAHAERPTQLIEYGLRRASITDVGELSRYILALEAKLREAEADTRRIEAILVKNAAKNAERTGNHYFPETREGFDTHPAIASDAARGEREGK